METAHAGPSARSIDHDSAQEVATTTSSMAQPTTAGDGFNQAVELLSAVKKGKRKATDEHKDHDKSNPPTPRRPSRSDSLSSWLPKHDARLRRLVSAAGAVPDWKEIAKQMQHWSARQCEARFNKLSSQPNESGDGALAGEDDLDDSDADTAADQPPARPARRAAWSEAEDKILRDTVLARRAAGEPVDWASFPKILPGRTESACTKRWHHAFSRTVEGGSGLWTAEEDEILLSNVLERRARGVRVDWASFPALLPGRSRIAVTQRWHNCLSKQAGVHETASGAGHWSAENDALLAAVVRRRRSEGLSNDWSAVAAHFPGRTALGCQKRWYQHVRAPGERRASGEAVEGEPTGEGIEDGEAVEAVPAGQKRPPLLNRHSSASGSVSHASSRTTSSGVSSATSAFPDTPPPSSTLGSLISLPSPTLKHTTSSSSIHALLHHTSADAGVAEILSSFSAASFAHPRPPVGPPPTVLEPPPSPRQVVERKPSFSRLSLAHLAPDSGPSSGEAVDEEFRFWNESDEEKGKGEEEGAEGRAAKRARVGLEEREVKIEVEEGRGGLPEHLSPFTFGLPGVRR